MSVQTLTLKGNGISVRIYFDKGLLHSIEISIINEVKRIRETIKFDVFPARTLDAKRLHDMIIIEHKYIEDGSEVFSERYSIEDYKLSILGVFNEQVGVK